MGGEAKLLLMCYCWVGFWAAFRLFLPLFVPTAVRWMRCGSQSLLLDDAGCLYDTNGRNLLDVQRYYIGLLTVSASPANLGRWCLEYYVDVTLG